MSSKQIRSLAQTAASMTFEAHGDSDLLPPMELEHAYESARIIVYNELTFSGGMVPTEAWKSSELSEDDWPLFREEYAAELANLRSAE